MNRDSELYRKKPGPDAIKKILIQLAGTRSCGHGEMIHRAGTLLDTSTNYVGPALKELVNGEEKYITFNKATLNYEPFTRR